MTEHAEHGASISEIFINCAGALNAMRGIENEDTPYTIEGSAAHDMAAQCLNGREPIEFLDRYIDYTTKRIVGGHPHIERIPVTEEMVNSVEMYKELFLEETGYGFDPDVKVFIEHRVTLNELAPGFPKPLFGTCDAGIYRRATRRLVVIDFKYGQGVVVEAEDNSQGRYYALGLLLDALMRSEEVAEVEIVICQPRTRDPIRRELLTVEELMRWGDEILIPAAWRTLPEDAPRTPGEHCRWCRAVECPERRAQELAELRMAFDDRFVPLPDARPPELARLTPEEKARLLDVQDRVLAFFKNLREDAFRSLNEDPTSIPGWKIVGRAGHRRWTNQTPEETALRLVFEHGVPEEKLWNRKIKSPAQMETVVKQMYAKRGRDPKAKASVIKMLDMVERPITGTTLARESDEREAVLGTDIVTFDRITFNEEP